MNRDQFLRNLRSHCRKSGLPAPEFDARRGKGGHGTVRIGQRFTVVPAGELKAGMLAKILKDLDLPKGAV